MTDEMKTVCQFERSRQEAKHKFGLETGVSENTIHLFANERSIRFDSVDAYSAFVDGWKESKEYHHNLEQH